MALRGRRVDNFVELWCLGASVDVTFFENWWMKLKFPNLMKPLGIIIQ